MHEVWFDDGDCPLCGEYIGTNAECGECKKVIQYDEQQARAQERKAAKLKGKRHEPER